MGFLFLTLKTGLAGLTALTGTQLSLIWRLQCSVTHLLELSGPQHVRDISNDLSDFTMLSQHGEIEVHSFLKWSAH